MSGRDSQVPERIAWAVDLLDIGPDDEILEIGCGPGVAVSLVCGPLEGGRITGIDRSAHAIGRATERNAEHIAAERAVLRQTDLAALRQRSRPVRQGLRRQRQRVLDERR